MSSSIGVLGFCGPGRGRGCLVFYPASVLLSLYLGLFSLYLGLQERIQLCLLEIYSVLVSLVSARSL